MKIIDKKRILLFVSFMTMFIYSISTFADGEIENIVDQKELSSQGRIFQATLNRSGIPGKLTNCKMMIRINSKDASYGAICNLNKREIMICDDMMVGKITLIVGGFVEAIDSLEYFTKANCHPGG